jgi:hypothetical protein
VKLVRHDLLVNGRSEKGEFRLARVTEQAVAEFAILVAFRPQVQDAERRGDVLDVVHRN